KEPSPRKLGGQLPSFNSDVHLAEPSVQVKTTIAFTGVGGDVKLDDVGLVLGQRGSRHSLTEVSELTRHELLGGQALLFLSAGRKQSLDDSIAGCSSEPVQPIEDRWGKLACSSDVLVTLDASLIDVSFILILGVGRITKYYQV
ncbi:hypothetical protein L915_15764, partial [Phytophthora nicotianae]